MSPPEDELPKLRPRGLLRRAPAIRATFSQWNAMRVALGPLVPDKSIAELLIKHGDDIDAAIVDFYGPSYAGR